MGQMMTNPIANKIPKKDLKLAANMILKMMAQQKMTKRKTESTLAICSKNVNRYNLSQRKKNTQATSIPTSVSMNMFALVSGETVATIFATVDSKIRLYRFHPFQPILDSTLATLVNQFITLEKNQQTMAKKEQSWLSYPSQILVIKPTILLRLKKILKHLNILHLSCKIPLYASSTWKKLQVAIR